MATLSNPVPGRAPRARRTDYNLPIGYLRGVLVALVVAHHAALAYHPAGHIAKDLVAQPRWWQAFPVVDAHQWTNGPVFTGFNDIFFMALMFFLSGLFVWRGLKAKGAAAFYRDRLRRLGPGFLVLAAVVAPLAYTPTFVQAGVPGGVAGFWRVWLALRQWPAGPGWFLWVLLVFDLTAALLFLLAPRVVGSAAAVAARLGQRPVLFFGALAALSALAYVPMEFEFGPYRWSVFGPFAFQTARLLHYWVYFLLGGAVGAAGLDEGLLATSGRLVRRWGWWVAACLTVFFLETAAYVAAISGGGPVTVLRLVADTGFSLSCAATSMAFLAVFLRFARNRSAALASLSANSYAIYLLHYAFVSWVGYLLLPVDLPGGAKWALSFALALALSWAAAAALRRIPAVARIV